MAFYNLIGRRGAVPQLEENLRVNVLLLKFYAYLRSFAKVLIETNLNISNEFNFPDSHRSVNYIGSLAKFTCHFARDPI